MSTSQTQIKIQAQKSIKLIPQASELSIKELHNPTSSTTPIKPHPPKPSSFPLSNLPPELRHEIYAHYFANLPSHYISCATISQYNSSQRPNTPESSLPSFHTEFQLYLASIFFTHDIPSWIYYHHATFSFSCPSALKSFTAHPLAHTYVRKIRISYGGIGEQGPDWVYLLLKGFERLEEVVFVVDVEDECGCCGVASERLNHWWGCVGDAFREGMSLNGKGMKGGKVRLKLETRSEDECVIAKES
ncbi:hypothetical protein EG329_002966 [Mollisiaceae sp. DMI_Dod_QoI]|nr:hypothetical protein EG329_002966 [Helotiales sp. DMI_Dod_QoI]